MTSSTGKCCTSFDEPASKSSEVGSIQCASSSSISSGNVFASSTTIAINAAMVRSFTSLGAISSRVAPFGRDRQQGCQEGAIPLLSRPCARSSSPVSPAARQLVRRSQTRATPDLAGHRMERVVDTMRRALIAQTMWRSPPMRSRSAARTRDLPMPASPDNSAT